MDINAVYQMDFLKDKLKSLHKAIERESLPNGLESCEWKIVDGKIVEESLSLAKEVKADIIVVGTEGMS